MERQRNEETKAEITIEQTLQIIILLPLLLPSGKIQETLIYIFTILVEDPYRWILSRGKPAVQSSTEGSHEASYATDGDYNNFELPMKYSQTTVSDNPYLQVDLGQNVYVVDVVLSVPILTETIPVVKNIWVTLGMYQCIFNIYIWYVSNYIL